MRRARPEVDRFEVDEAGEVEDITGGWVRNWEYGGARRARPEVDRFEVDHIGWISSRQLPLSL